MNTLSATQSPLRLLREHICLSRANFCRRNRLGYQGVALAEVGLISTPVNFVRVLANLTHRPAEELLKQHQAWLATVSMYRPEEEKQAHG